MRDKPETPQGDAPSPDLARQFAYDFVQVAARERLKAIGLMVLATICFAFLDSTAKYLVGTKRVPVVQVTWLRFAGHVVFSALVLWPFAFRPSLRSKRPLMQIFRSVLMIVTTGFNFVALRYLQLDQTITIFFLTPLVVALLAGPLLNEWVGWHRMLAIVVGFLGVLLVMHPGIGTLHWAMLFVLIATLGYALYNHLHALSRRLRPGRGDADLYAACRRGAAAAFRACRLADAAGRADLGAVCATLGFWGGLGHWLLILAHRSAPASVLAPFIYLGLIWMSAAGFLVFGDVPTWWTLSGAAVVILSGLYLLSRERKVVGPRGRPSFRHRLAIKLERPRSAWSSCQARYARIQDDVVPEARGLARLKAGHDEAGLWQGSYTSHHSWRHSGGAHRRRSRRRGPLDGLARARHQLLIEMHIGEGEQHGAERLFGAHQMMQIGPLILRRRTRALRHRAAIHPRHSAHCGD